MAWDPEKRPPTGGVRREGVKRKERIELFLVKGGVECLVYVE